MRQQSETPVLTHCMNIECPCRVLSASSYPVWLPTKTPISGQSPSFPQPQSNNIIWGQQNQQSRPIRNQTSPTFTARSSSCARAAPRTPCLHCGTRHWASSCPYRSTVCFHYGLKGHLSRVCRSQLSQAFQDSAGLPRGPRF